MIEFGYRGFVIRKVGKSFKVLNRNGFTQCYGRTLEICQRNVDILISNAVFNIYTKLRFGDL